MEPLTRDYKIGLFERLQSPEHCFEYVKASVDGGDEALRMALGDMLEAQTWATRKALQQAEHTITELRE